MVGPHGCIFGSIGQVLQANRNTFKVAVAIATEWVLANEIGRDVYEDLVPSVKYKKVGEILRAYMLENEIIQFSPLQAIRVSPHKVQYSFSFVSLISSESPWLKRKPEEPSKFITTDHLITISEDK